jgi:hypothetical protein
MGSQADNQVPATRAAAADHNLTICDGLFGYGSVISTPAVWPGGIVAYPIRPKTKEAVHRFEYSDLG